MASKDEVAVLKAKLKKANANHEKLVCEWAQQGVELQKEVMVSLCLHKIVAK